MPHCFHRLRIGAAMSWNAQPQMSSWQQNEYSASWQAPAAFPQLISQQGQGQLMQQPPFRAPNKTGEQARSGPQKDSGRGAKRGRAVQKEDSDETDNKRARERDWSDFEILWLVKGVKRAMPTWEGAQADREGKNQSNKEKFQQDLPRHLSALAEEMGEKPLTAHPRQGSDLKAKWKNVYAEYELLHKIQNCSGGVDWFEASPDEKWDALDRVNSGISRVTKSNRPKKNPPLLLRDNIEIYDIIRSFKGASAATRPPVAVGLGVGAQLVVERNQAQLASSSDSAEYGTAARKGMTARARLSADEVYMQDSDEAEDENEEVTASVLRKTASKTPAAETGILEKVVAQGEAWQKLMQEAMHRIQALEEDSRKEQERQRQRDYKQDLFMQALLDKLGS